MIWPTVSDTPREPTQGLPCMSPEVGAGWALTDLVPGVNMTRLEMTATTKTRTRLFQRPASRAIVSNSPSS
jgi:hypothetical protein